MKMAKFLVSHFDAGVEKFTAGEAYPLDDETSLCIARGTAEEVDVVVEDREAAEKAKAEAEAEAEAAAKADREAAEKAASEANKTAANEPAQATPVKAKK